MVVGLLDRHRYISQRENPEKESGFQDHEFTFVHAAFRCPSDIEEHMCSTQVDRAPYIHLSWSISIEIIGIWTVTEAMGRKDLHRTQAKFRLRRKKGLGPNSEELVSKGLYSSGFSRQTEPTGCAYIRGILF